MKTKNILLAILFAAITLTSVQAQDKKPNILVIFPDDVGWQNISAYSLGTKNKTLKFNADGSLTLYAGATSPGADKESNWLPAPDGKFSLYMRCYWSEQAILDGTWMPPQVELVK